LFEEVKPDSNNISEEYFLNCKILLPSALQQSISFEAEGTNTVCNLGVGGNIQYENKNIFGGAEIFNFKINSQIAIQKVFENRKNRILVHCYLLILLKLVVKQELLYQNSSFL
jgi:hypothetical protein